MKQTKKPRKRGGKPNKKPEKSGRAPKTTLEKALKNKNISENGTKT
jgi:hypothetical protein